MIPNHANKVASSYMMEFPSVTFNSPLMNYHSLAKSSKPEVEEENKRKVIDNFYTSAINSTLKLCAIPALMPNRPGLGCIALFVEHQLRVVNDTNDPKAEESLDFLFDLSKQLHQLFCCPGARNVEPIIKLLDETFENVLEYLDKALSELPNLFKRYGLSFDLLKPWKASNPKEKTPPVFQTTATASSLQQPAIVWNTAVHNVPANGNPDNTPRNATTKVA